MPTNDGPECVWLIRHAETSTPDVFHGAESDVDLSALGERQAAALGDWFRDQRPDVVISSAMIRAVRTAQAVVGACGIPHAIVPELHERRIGILSGKPFETISGLWAETLAAWSNGEIDATTEGAESYAEVRSRALVGWEAVLRIGVGKRVVIVAHGITCKVLLLSLLADCGPTAWHRLGRIPNVAVSLLHPREGAWHAETIARIPESVAALNGGRPTGLGVAPATDGEIGTKNA